MDINTVSKSNDNKESGIEFTLNAVEAAIKSIEGGNIDVSEKSISDTMGKSSVVMRRGTGEEAGGGARGGGALAHAPAACLACVRARPPSSHELRLAFFSG